MKKLKLLCGWIGYVLLAIGIVYGTLFFVQDEFIFHPNKTYISPSVAGMPVFEEVNVGGQVAWFSKGNKQKPAILYFHGNTGQNADFVSLLKPYIKENWAVYMVEYCGFGKSPGTPSEKCMIENGVKGYDFLKDQGYSSIIFHGFSIGTGVALGVFEKRKADGFVLEGAFYSIVQMAKSTFPLPFIGCLLRNKFLSNERILNVNVPLLFIHGTDDKTVPYKQGLALYNKALSLDKTFIGLEKSPHWTGRYGSFEEIIPWVKKRFVK